MNQAAPFGVSLKLKGMIQIVNKYIPFKGYIAMATWPFLWIRREYVNSIDPIDINHEKIHGAQQREILIPMAIIGVISCLLGLNKYWMIAFLLSPQIIYILTWLITSIILQKNAYRESCFECEAFANEKYPQYLKHRKPFAWVIYCLI